MGLVAGRRPLVVSALRDVSVVPGGDGGSHHPVERPRPDYFYWPVLDVDLFLKSIEDHERFPLVSNPKETNSNHWGGTPDGLNRTRGRLPDQPASSRRTRTNSSTALLSSLVNVAKESN